MIVPEGWLELDEVDSTQRVAREIVAKGQNPGMIFARHQSHGRGRFDRVWHSGSGDSLTFTLLFWAYPDHPEPHLIGMACAIGAAQALGTDLRWPNDLTFKTRKTGGILTELLVDSQGSRIAAVGIGVNLNQAALPDEIAQTATSLAIEMGGQWDPRETASRIVAAIAELPEPTSWEALADAWLARDQTAGKQYRLASGEVVTAIKVGERGELIADSNGTRVEVLAADGIFGERKEP